MGVYTLDSPIAIPNGTRLVIDHAREVLGPDPDVVVELVTTIQLRSAAASNRRHGTYVLTTRNGLSDVLILNQTFLAGMEVQDVLEVIREGVTTATGLDTALAAWRSGNAGGGRKTNLLNELKNLAQIRQSGIGAIPGSAA